MSKIKILVVEDERIVAKDIQNSLNVLGYEVPAIASSGEEAVEKVEEINPDVILMDIVLKGEIDGIEAAKQIRSKLQVPIIYLTAYEDSETLDRAKVTDPLGYILKPFEERDLHTTLEMALYKHRLQRMLEDSEEKYRSLVELSPDGIAIITDGKVSFINKSGVSILGYKSAEKLLGKLPEEIICKDDYNNLKKVLFSETKNQKSTLAEVQMIKSDKSLFDVEISATRLPVKENPVSQIIFRDITMRKKAEKELKKAYDELRETQTALINSEKLAALGRFSAGIAHEIRNPLANISASAQFFLTKYPVDDEMKKYFDVILRNSETANRIIKELLDFTSNREMTFQKNNLNHVIDSVYEHIKTRCASHGIQIHKKTNDIPDILLNSKKLEEALLNFASNAIDAMPVGGELNLSTFHDRENNCIKITITDNGSGIPDQHLDKIFEPFFTTKDHGTGLGMSLAYQIVTSHGGKIDIESEEEKGTTIHITLPVKN